jgi:hypothetical protein
MAPFWWAYSDLLNDNILTHQLTSLRRFTDSIPFSKLTNITPADIRVARGHAYAMQSDQLVFGWVVNPVTDVAGEKVTLKGLPHGRYRLKIYHTWRGQTIQETQVDGGSGTIEFSIPRLRAQDSHANYIGQDVAFMLEAVVR